MELVDGLNQIQSQLKPDGPPVNYEALHLYIAGDLDEDTSKRVWQHIATWRAWWDAWQEEMLLLTQDVQSEEKSRQRPRWLTRRSLALFAIAASLILILGWYSWPRERIQFDDGVAQVTMQNGRIVSDYPAKRKTQMEDAFSTEALRIPDHLIENLRVSRSVGFKSNYIRPVATVIQTQRPTFAWQTEGDGYTYEIVVYHVRNDLEKNPEIKRSSPQSSTSWTIPVKLTRGETYEWEVLSYEGEERGFWNEPRPRFRVLGDDASADLQRDVSEATGSHTLLLLSYLDKGLMDDVEQQLHALAEDNPELPIFKTLIRNLKRDR